MANNNSVLIKFFGDAKDLVGSVNTAAASLGRLERSAKATHTPLAEMQTRMGHARRAGLEMAAGFIGVTGVVYALEESVRAAESFNLAHANLEKALTNVGKAARGNSALLNEFVKSESDLSAFTRTSLVESLTRLVRETGTVGKAMKDAALAADIARGSNRSLEEATKLVQQAEAGRYRGLGVLVGQVVRVTKEQDVLRASGVAYTKGQMDRAKADDLAATKAGVLAAATQKFSGSAKLYGDSSAGSIQKFHNAVEELQIAIGQGLLPEITKLVEKLTPMIEHFVDSGKAAKDVHAALAAIEAVAKIVSGAFNVLSDAVGGSKHAVELLTVAFVALKAAEKAALITSLAGSLTKIGTAAGTAGAAGAVATLSSRLAALAKMGPIIVPVGLAYFVSKYGLKNVAGSFNPFGDGTLGPGIAAFPKGEPMTSTPYSRAAEARYRQQHGLQSAKGASGPITAGLSAVEKFAGGKINDDYATSGHATNSYHYKGQAADLAVDRAVWNRLFANRAAFAELFGPWGLYHYGVQFYDAKLQKDHMNHIHVAYTGGPQAISKMVGGARGGAGAGSGGGGRGGGGTFNANMPVALTERLSHAQAFGGAGDQRGALQAQLAWATGEYALAKTTAQKVAIEDTIASIRSSLDSLTKAAKKKVPGTVRGDALVPEPLLALIAHERTKAANAVGSALIADLRSEQTAYDKAIAGVRAKAGASGQTAKQAAAYRKEIDSLQNRRDQVHAALKDALFPSELARITAPFVAKLAVEKSKLATLMAKAARQTGEELAKTDVAIIDTLLAEKTTLTNERARLKASLAGKDKAQRKAINARISAIDTALGRVISDAESALSNLQQAVDQAAQNVGTNFGNVQSEILSQFQAQTQAHIDELAKQFFQGTQTASEAALAKMQAEDAQGSDLQGLIDALNSGDTQAINAAKRRIVEDQLATKAAQERADADQAYAAAVKVYTDQRTLEESELTRVLQTFGAALQNGTATVDQLQGVLDGANQYGINFGVNLNALSKSNALVTGDFNALGTAVDTLTKLMDALSRKIAEVAGVAVPAPSTSSAPPPLATIPANTAGTLPNGAGVISTGPLSPSQQIDIAAGRPVRLAPGQSVAMAGGGLKKAADGLVAQRAMLNMGSRTIFGEAGPEAYLPLDNPKAVRQIRSALGGGGGGGSFHLHVGTLIGTSPDALALSLEPLIYKALLNRQRRNGNLAFSASS